MNIRFLITAAVVATSISLYAQGKPPAGGAPGGAFGQRGGGGQRGPGMRSGMPTELKKQLNLTPAQEKKLQAIREKYMAKLKAAGAGPGAGKPGGQMDFKKIKPIIDQMRKEMDAVYTPKQRDVLKKWRDAHPRRGPGGAGGPGGMRGPGGKAGGKGG
jgi:Spy/CpxP family protein refolding chaperone